MFEYNITTIKGNLEKIIDIMNQFGKDGWDIFGCDLIKIIDDEDILFYELKMKRKLCIQ